MAPAHPLEFSGGHARPDGQGNMRWNFQTGETYDFYFPGFCGFSVFSMVLRASSAFFAEEGSLGQCEGRSMLRRPDPGGPSPESSRSSSGVLKPPERSGRSVEPSSRARCTLAEDQLSPAVSCASTIRQGKPPGPPTTCPARSAQAARTSALAAPAVAVVDLRSRQEKVASEPLR